MGQRGGETWRERQLEVVRGWLTNKRIKREGRIEEKNILFVHRGISVFCKNKH